MGIKSGTVQYKAIIPFLKSFFYLLAAFHYRIEALQGRGVHFIHHDGPRTKKSTWHKTGVKNYLLSEWMKEQRKHLEDFGRGGGMKEEGVRTENEFFPLGMYSKAGAFSTTLKNYC